MSTLSNKVQLIGNVGDSPRITNLESGSKVARLSMATNEYYRNAQGEKVQSTQWHYVVAWDKRADIIEMYATKGKQIAIEGKLISRSYTNEMGVKCYVTEIVANEILLLGSKNGNAPLSEIEVVETVEESPNEEVKEAATENKNSQGRRTSSRKNKTGKAA